MQYSDSTRAEGRGEGGLYETQRIVLRKWTVPEIFAKNCYCYCIEILRVRARPWQRMRWYAATAYLLLALAHAGSRFKFFEHVNLSSIGGRY